MSALEHVAKLEEIIEYKFKNKSSLLVAISHPGTKKNNLVYRREFERLEFLGDRVLGLSLANFLYEKFPSDSEGDLAMRIATLAGTDFLINLAKKTNIIDCFSIPKDFFISIHKNSSAIADMMEAVFGSVFLDSNFETIKEVIQKLWEDDIFNIVYKKKDSKSKLQEISQARSDGLPVYRLLKMTGEAHDPVFEMEVTACGISMIGYGNSKKNAEHDAAGRLVEKIESIEEDN